MSFYQQSTISLYSWFFVSLVLQYIFYYHFMDPFSSTLNWSELRPRLQGDGVMGCITMGCITHDEIPRFWLAEVRNFTNIMI